MSWSKRFEPEIPLPDGGALSTLADARDYILALPAADQQHDAVQTAAHVILGAAEQGGPMAFARIGVSKMLRRHDPPAPPRPRKRRRL